MGRPATNDKTNLSSLAATALILAFVLWVASFATQPARLYAQTAAPAGASFGGQASAGASASGDAS
jgi:uncharacterized membrane protein